MIKVGLVGASGKMGKEIAKEILYKQVIMMPLKMLMW
jgi:dihydrodipicolinate reductase